MGQRVFHSMEEVRRELFPNTPPPGKVKCDGCAGRGYWLVRNLKCAKCDGTGFAPCPHCSAPTFRLKAAGDPRPHGSE